MRDLPEPDLKVIVVTRDCTPQQREDNKKLRQELIKRKERGEDVMIRGSKIVRKPAPHERVVSVERQTPIHKKYFRQH